MNYEIGKFEEKDKGAHMWAAVRKLGKYALPPQRIVLQSYLASCRHLWHRIVSSLPSPPPGIIWQLSIQRITRIRIVRRGHVY